MTLAAWRLAQVVTADKLTAGWRRRLARAHPPGRRGPHWLVVLVNCQRCVGTWTSGLTVLAAVALGLASWRVAVLAWPAASAVIAMLALTGL